MRQFRDWPAALQRKWLLSWAAGAAFLTVGITVFLALEDRPLLIISTLLAAVSPCAAWPFTGQRQAETMKSSQASASAWDTPA